MNISLVTCPLCGNTNYEKFAFDKEKVSCLYCNTTFVLDIFDDFNLKLTNFFDEQKQEKIANIRFNLWSAVHEELKSTEKISHYAKELKKLSPDDFLANFYDTICNGNCQDVNDFLNNITDYKNLKPFIEDIVEFMLSSFEEKNILALKNLIMNTFDNKQKTDYLTILEDESFKLSNGIYTSFIPRDVFIAYSSKDTNEVNSIVEYLENQDISCYVAIRNLRHGKGSVENYQNELKNAINNSKCVVFISSKNSRNLGCDALKIELKYIQEKLPNLKRVEYILEDYDYTTPPAVKGFLKSFFKNLEHCRTLDDLSKRIFDIVMDYYNLDLKEEKQIETKNDTTNYKFCQECGNQNLLSAKFCKNCRHDKFFNNLNDFENSKNMLYCLDCFNLNDLDAHFCLNCGGNNLVKFTDRDKTKNQNLSKSFDEVVKEMKKEKTSRKKKNDDTINSNQFLIDVINEGPLKQETQKEIADNSKDTNKSKVSKDLDLSKNKKSAKNGEKSAKIIENDKSTESITISNIKPKDTIKSQSSKKPINSKSTNTKKITASKTTLEKENTTTKKSKTKETNSTPTTETKKNNSTKSSLKPLVKKENIETTTVKPKTSIKVTEEIELALNKAIRQYKNKKFKEAVKTFQEYADLEIANAQYYLGLCYFGGEGVDKDYKKAVDLFSKSAKKGNSDAQFRLGYAYYFGRGVKKDQQMAVEFYKKSAKQENSEALKNLGHCYLYGNGIRQNKKKAIEYYTASAKLGNADAQFRLGECYEQGELIEQDLKKAVSWYKKAYKKGSPEAERKLKLKKFKDLL